MGKLHGASRAPWKAPTNAAASDCVDELATGPTERTKERPTFSDRGSIQRSAVLAKSVARRP
jgi:hypothetical protein